MNLETLFKQYGLVEINSLSPSIKVELKYATADNFMHQNLYGKLTKAYAIPEIAERLCKAQKNLSEISSNLNLLIYDAARPMSIQRRMFEKVKGTSLERYVASPLDGGGYHNFGLAVDLTIARADGTPLDMGTPFDSFDSASHVGNEDILVSLGQISSEARQNRALLKKIMTEAGFDQNHYEWWHFQRYSKKRNDREFQASRLLIPLILLLSLLLLILLLN